MKYKLWHFNTVFTWNYFFGQMNFTMYYLIRQQNLTLNMLSDELTTTIIADEFTIYNYDLLPRKL